MQVMLENYRADQLVLTTSQLQENNFTNRKNVKKMYNYGLTKIREKFELETELQQEFRFNKLNPDTFRQHIIRQQEAASTYGAHVKKQLKKKYDKIYG